MEAYYPDDNYRVADDDNFRIDQAPQQPPADHDTKQSRRQLKQHSAALDDLQRRFYAQKTHALLLIFQGMDAAGKDGTIRAVMRDVDPAGCHVKSFKQPTSQERAHDFLWRTTAHLPERGHIHIFNRSYYEEVLIVRVHPQLLEAQQLPQIGPQMGPQIGNTSELWLQRFEAIRAHEQHLARSGTLVLKFFLNVSYEEQRRRFIKRLDNPDKHWKFSDKDVHERGFWDSYMQAFEAALNATSRPWAPWYAIPADDKDYMRCKVAEITRRTLKNLNPDYPEVNEEQRKRLKQVREELKRD